MPDELPAPRAASPGPVHRPRAEVGRDADQRLAFRVEGLTRQVTRDGGELLYAPSFFDAAVADMLFTKLRDEIPWEHVRIHGVPQRLGTYWIGPRPYTYSRQTGPAAPWLPTPRAIVAAVESFLFAGLDDVFESVFLNDYASGEVKLGFHADDESIIPPGSPIASISLGASRRFVLRHNATGETRELALGHGSHARHGRHDTALLAACGASAAGCGRAHRPDVPPVPPGGH